jgi:hypothetical protein
MLPSGQRSLTDAVEQLKTVVTKLQQEITSVDKAPEGLAHQAVAWSSLPVFENTRSRSYPSFKVISMTANADVVISLYQMWLLTME